MPAKLVATRYELRELLGEGGMGFVYRAIDTRTGGLVAIKTMRDGSDPRTLEMFKREWRVLARLSHPNIVDIRDVDEIEEDGVRKPCFVMPLLSGVTLAQLIKESSSRITVARLIGIISQVCNGLEAAHRSELIHRDLKPSNIFVMEDDTAKIIDFGLVHAADANSVTSYKGTWQYMAPEQTEGKNPTVQSDIFSLGIVAYEAFTGRKPFARKSVESTIEAVRSHIPPAISEINPKVSQLLSKVIHKAMAKLPVHRYASAKEFGETLQKAARNEPIERFDAAKILPRVERARKAFTRDDCAFASEILTELEAEGNVDPEITLLRAQIEEAVKHKRIAQLYEGAQTRLEQDEIPLALDKLREILALDPENQEALSMRKRIEEQRNKQQISDWMKLARQHVERHDFPEARQALKEVLNIRYDDSDALHLLSEIDVQEKDAAKARAEKEQLYGSALKAYQGGEISTALSKLEKILDVSRRIPGATVPERDAVYQSFYNRVRSERDSIDKAYEDGRRYMNEKDFQKALEICNHTLATYPNSAQFQALKLQVEQAERQELSAYIAEVGRSADSEPDLDRRVSILEEAGRRYPNEGQFQQSLRLLREQRDLVHSILVKARQYDEQSQFADAIGQWKILRSIHPQYPGIEFEIGQLEKRREKQSAEEQKIRSVDQIDRAIENGVYARALEVAQYALTEFPQDSELLVLERIARQGLERIREAERLAEEARAARTEGRFDEAVELLQRALELDGRNAGIRSALVSLYIERAHALLNEDWRKAEPLVEAAARIDENHPAVQRLRSLVADARRRGAISQLVADARQMQLSGDVRGALGRVSDGLTHYPGDARLLQCQLNLQNALSPPKEQPRTEEAVPAVAVAHAADAPAADGLSDLYQRTRYQANSIVEHPKPPKPAEETTIVKVQLARPSRFSEALVALGMLAQRARSTVSTSEWMQPNRLRLGLLSVGAAALLIVAAAWVSNHRGPKKAVPETQPSVQSAVRVPVNVTPDGTTLTIDGKAQPEGSLSLDRTKSYDVVASRAGYKSQHQNAMKPVATGWTFTLEPEPLRMQVTTGDRGGKLLLDGKEIWNLQRGDLTNYEMAPDGGAHTLVGRNQTGDLLFNVVFRATPGGAPEVEALKARDLVVGSSLGKTATILSGNPAVSVSASGQNAQTIARTGTPIQFNEGDPDQVMLDISDGRRHQEFALLRGNAPALTVSLMGNPNVGAVTIDVSVPAAQLFFDGRERKTGKPGHWRLSGITPGPHEVRLTAPGYADESRTVTIEKGQEAKQDFEMKVAAAVLAISGGTAGAEVLIDGVSAGNLDGTGSLRTRTSPGTHKIDLQKDDFESASLTKTFSAGQPTDVSGKETTLKAFGTLTFQVSPPNGTFQYRRVDESEWHAKPASGQVKVKPGRYEVRGEAPQYSPSVTDTLVGAGGVTSAHLDLNPLAVRKMEHLITPDFFFRPSDVHPNGQWYSGNANTFLALKTRPAYTFTFLNPKSVPIKHKGKKVEWHVALSPDDEIDYELDGQQLIRTVRANERAVKTPRKLNAWDGDYAILTLSLAGRRVVVTARGGVVLDDFADDQHDWSRATVFLRGDQFFLVAEH